VCLHKWLSAYSSSFVMLMLSCRMHVLLQVCILYCRSPLHLMLLGRLALGLMLCWHWQGVGLFT
jgi:hypothetical protein